jgi:ABC-2 type transport system ATP-binding protein
MRVELNKVSKWYGQVIGVNSLSLVLTPGVTGFLGPNGAGKTTLLRLLTGQLKPSQGLVTLGGQPVWANHRVLDDMGYCPEMDAFWPFLTGRQFVTSLLRIHGYGRDEAEAKAQKAIRIMDMEEAQDKRIGGYSKGMRQRIKMAQAIAHDPKVLFLDEPLNGMDPLGRRTTMDIIQEMGKKGKTVVVSSHVLHEVEEMTDTIILINHGRLLAEGNIYEIRKLIDNHPLQVAICCDKLDVLTSRLMEFGDVLSLHFNRDRNQVIVETDQPEAFHRRLPEIALKSNVTIHSLWSPDESLEAVFDYLVR